MAPYVDAAIQLLAQVLADDPNDPGDGDTGPPPGSPPRLKFEGPWFLTQLTLSASIGLISFLVFSYCRTRWPLLFAPRTKLKGFSPHEAHAHLAFFGWILPTIRTSEFTVLQIVGLDAAVLLSFLKMSFWLFTTCSLLAAAILMPINLKNNIDIGDGREDGTNTFEPPPSSDPQIPRSSWDNWFDLISDANSYLSVHLIFTYIFTITALRAIYKNFKRFIRSRQLFSLELVHSVPARTVMVSHLPPHLRTEPALAEYFEQMDLCVESVNICREVGSLRRLLDVRTNALVKLESAWVDYLGNPSVVAPDTSIRYPLVDVDDAASIESQPEQLVLPNRKRPTVRPGWFSRKVDAIEYYEDKFSEADELVKKRRRTGRFKPTHVAFVTFEKMSSAQIAAQAVHAPHPMECLTHLAPEPRDIVWQNISHSPSNALVREWIVMGAMVVLQFFWFIPITALASLLSPEEIRKTMPWLADLMDRNEHLGALMQTLSSLGMVTLNATLPFLLEGLTYIQAFPARSWIEYSVMKKYFLFLLINVVFIFLVASTYWQLVRDLASSPARGLEKLAQALNAGNARHFFVSYVILQGFGLMPLQLLNLGIIIPRFFFRLFITRTPRDYAELNAPPMINYGVVYPQAILVFVITLLYSVIQPLILVFGAVYFGVAYVVYKYKLLFVFYKPYESQGQAWPITFVRLIWGVIIFIIFMSGMFIVKKSFVLATLLAPLLAGTLLWWYYTDKQFRPLSKYVSLSSVHEVERGEESADVVRLRAGHPVTWSQSNLNRRRYAQNDETLYVAPADERTDYSQPPMANFYSGVLNTGKRRYGHPALTGVLPFPWLPIKKGQSLNRHRDTGDDGSPAVVLTLRKKYSVVRDRPQRQPSDESAASGPSNNGADGNGTPGPTGDRPEPSDRSVIERNPWEEDPRPRPRTQRSGHSAQVHRRLSFDAASGVIALPEDENWLGEEDSDSDDYGELQNSTLMDSQVAEGDQEPRDGSPGTNKRYSTYYHHPERRKTYTRS
ncbi:DUF221-domain-containing protein [Lentinus tigrinus ALCF2SS1-7]|uniref:DUF221-domain-containing protein n=1 Tax=Lentinus tigrinus ALCF2SS1-6 TaxID=1328759 RepID=A0A5C2SUE1_9APHY|nr:DUF221-domain-containing protein [Lentinus tigrinus ALCF2SS1-6]RPD80970.1 DUF221-domain-containing protein [Lentinus tigrinus ALCF2SS1-7]